MTMVSASPRLTDEALILRVNDVVDGLMVGLRDNVDEDDGSRCEECDRTLIWNAVASLVWEVRGADPR